MASDIVVSVDLDETLTTDNGLERTIALGHLDELAARREAPYDRAAAEYAIDEFLASAREGDRDYDLFIARFFERYCATSDPLVDAASAFRAAVLRETANFVVAIPGARETLSTLDRLTIPYAILTNGWTPLQEEKARLLDFRGRVFVSERIGARKPSPEAFSIVREHFGVPYRSIWHVGDNARTDCAGAKHVGMTSVWFDRHGEPYPSGVAAPDYVVRSHAELSALLVMHSSEAGGVENSLR